MSAQDITFGVEIECYLPNHIVVDNNIRIGGYHRGLQVPGLPQGWKAESDCSLNNPPHCREHGRYVAIEIVSPVLCGEDGIAQVKAVVAQLNDWHAKINTTCGLHVHVGVGSLKVMQKMVRLAAQHERAIYASTGTHSRQNGRWARSTRTEQRRKMSQAKVSETRLPSELSDDRYHVLNVQNYLLGRRPAVEFRAFAGTLNITKMLGHIQMAVGFVDYAQTINTTPAFVRTKDPQTGEAAVARMLRILKWTRNGGYGVIDKTAVPAIKKEFKRLAAKYDAQESV